MGTVVDRIVFDDIDSGLFTWILGPINGAVKMYMEHEDGMYDIFPLWLLLLAPIVVILIIVVMAVIR